MSRNRNLWSVSVIMLAKPLLLALVISSPLVAQRNFRVLHAFGAGHDGAGVWDTLAFDKRGNLYGTTSGGGAHGDGTVFELTPGANGHWIETVLHNFPSFSDDGGAPFSTPILDAAGNLYATTEGGGTHHSGAVLELAHDSWAETILYNFCSKSKCVDGGSPQSNLTVDEVGDLYGVAEYAFKLSRSSGGWNEIVLHRFTGRNGDGEGAIAGMIMDSERNLYGTTERGGDHDVGIVYRLRRTASGWNERLLHSFGAFHDDGQVPGVGALVLDSSGNLYGTTSQGGSKTCVDVGCGTVFKLTASANGDWQESLR